MTRFLHRLRGTIGTGLTWALGWAVGGLLIGVTSLVTPWLPWDAFFAVFDAPLPALAVPGFVGGVIFASVLGVAARHRRLADLSLLQFAAWGALGGLLLACVPAASAAVGFLTVGDSEPGIGKLTAMIAGPLMLLSSLSASLSLLLARRAERRDAARVRDGDVDGVVGAAVRELRDGASWPAAPGSTPQEDAVRERSR
ncbi:MAG: hypothetical protein V4813_18295 [Gemmatimonadota bacterium]